MKLIYTAILLAFSIGVFPQGFLGQPKDSITAKFSDCSISGTDTIMLDCSGHITVFAFTNNQCSWFASEMEGQYPDKIIEALLTAGLSRRTSEYRKAAIGSNSQTFLSQILVGPDVEYIFIPASLDGKDYNKYTVVMKRPEGN